MTRTPTKLQDFGDSFVTLQESLPRVCLQHKYYPSIVPTSRHNSRTHRYLSASFKKQRFQRNYL